MSLPLLSIRAADLSSLKMIPSFARLSAVAPTDAEYTRTQGHPDTIVTVKALGNEMVEVTQTALTVIRQEIHNKELGDDNGYIKVTSNNDNVKFVVRITIEHGGSKVIIESNVGGVNQSNKFISHGGGVDDRITRSIAELFETAGGTADTEVTITYTESGGE